MYKIFLTAIILIVVSGCEYISGDLSRGQAKKMLEQGPNKAVLDTITTKTQIARHADKKPPKLYNVWEKKALDRLQTSGYISLKMMQERSGYIRTEYYYVAPTDKLTPYITKSSNRWFEVAVGKIVINEITGITNAPRDENARIVKYTTRVKPNPLGKIMGLREKHQESQRQSAVVFYS